MMTKIFVDGAAGTTGLEIRERLAGRRDVELLVLPEERRTEMLKLAELYGVPIFEDDCYADLIWDGERPPALHAMSRTANVIHIGSFSKSIAPALRVGYIVAPWQILSRMLSMK